MESASSLLSADFLGTPARVWLAFIGIVASLPGFDLGVLHQGDREIGVCESLLRSAGYVGMATLFGAWFWWLRGAESGMA